MTSYVDDNLFPKVLVVEGAAPPTPAAGSQVIYIPSSTHHLSRKDSSGAVVDIETLAAGGGVTSLAGTANEIIASASTGAVTLSTPQAIGTSSSPSFASLGISGLTGSPTALRIVGATASGAPTSGAHLVGDVVLDLSAGWWFCTVAGTPGTWVQYGGSSITTASSQLGSNVSMTSANTYYDGPSLSLAAGKWLLIASLCFQPFASNSAWTAEIWDGTNVGASQQFTNIAGQSAVFLALTAIVTLGSTTTWKASAACGGGGNFMLAAAVTNAVGNNASTLVAAKLA